jgi:hypothetical protein
MSAYGFSQFLAVFFVKKVQDKFLLAYIKSLTVVVKIIQVTLFRELVSAFCLPAFPSVTLKGLSHEIDLKKFDENLQNLA